MNIVEAVKKMKPNQKVFSKEAQCRLVLSEDGYRLNYIDNCNVKGRHFMFNANEWFADDWEIEVEYVEFWVAWKAREEHGTDIRSEFWHKSVYYDSELPSGGDRKLSEKEIRGLWEIVGMRRA